MIRGYYLKYAPYMDKYTKEDIMGELDLLREDKRNHEKIHGKETAIKLSYFGDKFYITLFKFNDNVNKLITTEIYKTLEKALPKFIKVFELKSGYVVTAVPYFKDRIEDYIYGLAIDELLRITGFILQNITIDLANSVVDFIKSYANTNIYIEEEHRDE